MSDKHENFSLQPFLATIAVLLIGSTPAADAETTPESEADTAICRGLLKPAERIRAAFMILRGKAAPTAREIPIRRFPLKLDADGAFSFTAPGPGIYDLLIEREDGCILEGIDLRHPELRGPPAKDIGDGQEVIFNQLKEKDEAEIRKRALAIKTFADEKRILFVGGRGEHARLIMELLRWGKTSFKSKEPIVVWRIEAWDYRKRYGAWQREGYRVFRRHMLARDEFARRCRQFVPELGGIDLRAPVELQLHLPSVDLAPSILKGTVPGRKPATR